MRSPTASTLAHLRFSFSLFLTPVFFFSLGEAAPEFSASKAIALLLILTLGIFPASQGYNSFYDRDTGSIGGLESPPVVTSDLRFYSIALEVLALAMSFFMIGWQSSFLLFLYGVFSKLYSNPLVRLKRFPWLGWMTVASFQGAMIFWICRITMVPQDGGEGWLKVWQNPKFILSAVVSSLLIGASYPITQVYQHEEDGRRGDHTLSLFLGIKGTFIFSMILYSIALGLLFLIWGVHLETALFSLILMPGVIYLWSWARSVWEDPTKADFSRAHRFLKISSICSIFAFMLIVMVRTVRADEVLQTGVSSVLQKNGKPWFHFNHQKEGTIFWCDSGPLSQESYTLAEDGSLKSYHWTQLQTSESASIEKAGRQLRFTYQAGSNQPLQESQLTLSEKESQSLVVPPMLSDSILSHWTELEEKKSVNLLIAVPDRRDIFSFRIEREAVEASDQVSFVLKPTSFFVKLVVSPVHFVFHRNRKLLKVLGIRPPVKLKQPDGKLETPKTDIIFQ